MSECPACGGEVKPRREGRPDTCGKCGYQVHDKAPAKKAAPAAAKPAKKKAGKKKAAAKK
jgi:hypothetical protein